MKTNTYIIFIFSFLLLATTGVGAWYMREGIVHKIDVIRTHHLKEKQNKNLEFGNQLRINSEMLIEQEEIIKNAFFDAPSIVPFISGLEITGQNLGLEVVVEKVEYGTIETVDGSTLQPVTFAVQLIGPYTQIKTFLTDLSGTRKILRINELKLYKTQDTIYTVRMIIQGTILK